MSEIIHIIREEENRGEKLSLKRDLHGWYATISKVIAVSFSLFFLYTNYFGLISSQTHVGFYLLGTFVLCFFLYPATSKSPKNRISIFDGLFIAGVVLVTIYYIIDYPNVHYRLGISTPFRDVIAGWYIIIISLELARRVVGRVISIIGLGFLIYAYFGAYFPFGLGHAGFSLSRIAENLFWTTEGVFGMIAYIFASYIVLFVILGAFLEVSGTGTTIVFSGSRSPRPN